MALILNLETATKTCSVALAEKGNILACKELTSEQFSHAEKLNVFIEEVFAECSKSMPDLDAVAVSAGPGSYTGLRIGTSTAKGICYALEIPLIALSSLKALAYLRKDFDGLICPMFDARRMEVYLAVYNNQLENIKTTEAVVIESQTAIQEILDEGPVLFLGPGANKIEAVVQSSHAVFDLETAVSAKGMSALTYEMFVKSEFEDVAYFEPAYLKDFVAGKPKKLI